jgi:SAM-dependent methyltransferase
MNPWLDTEIARQQRNLADRQLAQSPWPPHFTALVSAVRGTGNDGDVLLIGSGPGHEREVLDRAGVEYRRLAGIDISPEAIRLARERYPESNWIVEAEGNGSVLGSNAIARSADIVCDTACVMHVDDWRAHLGALCRASRRWVVLHRVPISAVTERTETKGYGQTFPAWSFARRDLDDEMNRNGCSMVWKEFKADGDAVTLVYV